MKINKSWAGGFALLAACSYASAEIQMNGFASIVGGVMLSEDPSATAEAMAAADDAREISFRHGQGYTDNFNLSPESRFALQLKSDLGDNLTATVQLMGRGKDDFDPKFEWAYLTYEFSRKNQLSVGKLRLPFYKYSDYLDVGYAYNWVRPSSAMYNLQFSTYDGISWLTRFNLGNVDFMSNVVYGNLEDTFFKTTFPTEGSLEKVTGFNIQASGDWWSVYGAYILTEVNIPHPQIEGTADNLEAAGFPSETTSLLRMDGDAGDFFGVGFSVDNMNFVVDGEYSEVSVEDALFLTTKQWYLSLGYRFNEFLPYVLFESLESDENTSTSGEFAGPAVAAVQRGYDSQWFGYKGTSLGMRYDFHHSAALKVEYKMVSDIVDIGASSTYGTKAFASLGTPDDTGSLDLFSVSIDILF